MIHIQPKKLVLYSLLTMITFIQACNGCGKSKENKRDDDNKPLEWDVNGNLFKANVFIDNKSNKWLQSLKINIGPNPTLGNSDFKNAKAVIVVESDSAISPSLGTTKLAQAAWKWIKTFPSTQFGTAPFNVFDINGQQLNLPANIKEGEFAIVQHFAPNDITVGFYYAVAPKASNVETLDKTKALLAALYYDMLVCAHKAGMEHIILHAISSGILAGSGQEKAGSKKQFTREEFVKMTFEAMKQGIAKFQKENPKHALRIILNNWDKFKDKKDITIGQEMIKEVKQL